MYLKMYEINRSYLKIGQRNRVTTARYWSVEKQSFIEAKKLIER